MNEYHHVSPLFSRKKGLQGVSARQRKGPLRGGASRPARPRPLEAGALTFVIFRVKLYHLLGASLLVSGEAEAVGAAGHVVVGVRCGVGKGMGGRGDGGGGRDVGAGEGAVEGGGVAGVEGGGGEDEGGEGDAEAVEDVEGDGEVVEGDVGGDGAEAEDGVGAAVRGHAEAGAGEDGCVGGGGVHCVEGGACDEGGEGGLEVAAGGDSGSLLGCMRPRGHQGAINHTSEN